MTRTRKLKDRLRHQNFIGSVHFSADDEIFYGRIEGITDLVTFEGESVQALKRAFEEAVEDYLNICEEVGKPAYKSFKGSFKVRIPPRTSPQVGRKGPDVGHLSEPARTASPRKRTFPVTKR